MADEHEGIVLDKGTVDPDPSDWEEAESVTGRPNDIPIDDPKPAPLGGNSTMAERAAARKAVGKAQNKSVSSEDAESKDGAKPKRAPRKKAR